MKFTSALVSFVFSVFLSLSILEGMAELRKLEEKRNELRKNALCCRFVSESFRNTCNGYGFDSLMEWKKCCMAMWNLDYIGFLEPDSFVSVNEKENKSENSSLSEENLFYGVWILASRRYEVYFRKR